MSVREFFNLLLHPGAAPPESEEEVKALSAFEEAKRVLDQEVAAYNDNLSAIITALGVRRDGIFKSANCPQLTCNVDGISDCLLSDTIEVHCYSSVIYRNWSFAFEITTYTKELLCGCRQFVHC